MKLENNTAFTHWENEAGQEHEVRIGFDYQPFENPDYKDGHMVYPGCEAGVVITQVDLLVVNGWIDEWNGATARQDADWVAEIHDLINQQAKDAHDEDRSEDALLEKYDG